MSSPQHSPENSHRPVIVALIGAFALVDFFGLPNIIEFGFEELLPLFLGTIAAQLGLLAIWAVLGPQRWFVRLPVTLIVTLLLVGTILFGLKMSYEVSPTFGEMALYFLCTPLIFLSIQLPLWIFRVATGWRIVHRSAEDCLPTLRARQFHLQDLFIATTVVAGALGLAGLGLRLSRTPETGGWRFLVASCLYCSVWSAFSTLPCVWAGFVARSKVASTLAIAVYVVAMTSVVMGVQIILGGFGGFYWEVLIYLLAFHGALVGVMLGMLYLARSCGYVLQRPSRREPAGEPEDSSTSEQQIDPFAPSDMPETS